MRKFLLILVSIIIFASCQTYQSNFPYPIRNTYEDYYSLKTDKNYNQVWDVLIDEIILDSEHYPKVLEKNSGLLILKYVLDESIITRENKKDSTILINHNAYFIAPFTSTTDKELTKEELNELKQKQIENESIGYSDYIYPDKIEYKNQDVLLYIKLSDLGTEREIKLKFGDKGELKSTGNYEKYFLSQLSNKLNNK